MTGKAFMADDFIILFYLEVEAEAKEVQCKETNKIKQY